MICIKLENVGETNTREKRVLIFEEPTVEKGG